MALEKATQAADLSALYFEDLAVGQSASLVCTVEDGVVPSRDDESDGALEVADPPEAHPERFRFGQYVFYGIFTSGLVSHLIGTRLPGVSGVYLSQTFQYIAPVRVGDTITARVEIVEMVYSRKRVKLFCECLRDGVPVLEGEAWIAVLARADEMDAKAAP